MDKEIKEKYLLQKDQEVYGFTHFVKNLVKFYYSFTNPLKKIEVQTVQ